MTASAHVPTAPHYASFEVDQELRLVDGSVVANDEIEIVHELGRGGMSVVYRAVDLADGRREVVLKVANASSSTTTTTRFRNEARLGERLREHPNVAVASRVGQLDGPEGFEELDKMLRHLIKSGDQKRVRIENIQRVVARQFNVARNDLLSNRRTQQIVRPRQIAMYLSKVMTPRSLPEIGRRFGGRDHTTVLHAVRKIEDLMSQDHKLAQEIELLKRLILD